MINEPKNDDKEVNIGDGLGNFMFQFASDTEFGFIELDPRFGKLEMWANRLSWNQELETFDQTKTFLSVDSFT